MSTRKRITRAEAQQLVRELRSAGFTASIEYANRPIGDHTIAFREFADVTVQVAAQDDYLVVLRDHAEGFESLLDIPHRNAKSAGRIIKALNRLEERDVTLAPRAAVDRALLARIEAAYSRATGRTTTHGAKTWIAELARLDKRSVSRMLRGQLPARRIESVLDALDLTPARAPRAPREG